jgi:hypothetical protein
MNFKLQKNLKDRMNYKRNSLREKIKYFKENTKKFDKKHLLNNSINKIKNTLLKSYSTHYRFIIQTTLYLKNIGETIVDCLNSLNLKAVCQDTEEIKINIKNENFNKSDIIIFLYVKKVSILPDNCFYVFNLEQFYRFKNTIYLDTYREDKDFLDEAYEKSLGIFDYAMGNFRFYPEKWVKKLHYLPIPLYNLQFHLNSISEPLEKKYDILFFGGKNHRRKKIINYLKNNTFLEIKYVTRVFGNELNRLVQESRIVLNIHYEKASLLEVARLHDILRINTDAKIISEKSIDKDLMEKYKNIVYFIPVIKNNLENIELLLEMIENIIKKNTIENKKEDLDKINKNIVSIYNKTFNFYIEMDKKIKRYPYLFHKYKFNLINSRNNLVQYKIIQNGIFDNLLMDENANNLQYYAHLHCYDLNKFDEIYEKYIFDLTQYFKIVVTYSIGEKKLDKRFTVLKVPNKGMDIGGKFVMVDYLKKNNINSKFILMLHSKTNTERREMYFKPFFDNLKNLVGKLNSDIGLCVPNIIWGKNVKQWGRNTRYVNELLSYLDIASNNNLFPEGNCYVMSGFLAKKLFGDITLYNCLNTETSFDLNWVKWYYRVNEKNSKYIYEQWKTRNLYGNHINSKKGYKGMPDGQFEHAFERVVFQLCHKYRKKIWVAPFV